MSKFKPLPQKTYIPYALISCILAIFLVVGTTIAFFFDSDWGSSTTQMSGHVRIEAVGNPVTGGKYTAPNGDTYNSIEDVNGYSKLVINLQDDYPVLVPNMEMYIYANCRILQSNTNPLLRAKMELLLTEIDVSDDGENNASDIHSAITDIYGQFSDIILNDEWVKYTVPGETQEYFYYIGNINQTAGNVGDYLMKPINVSDNDAYIHFIDEPVVFPSYVDSSYSGFGVQIVITFEAIQDYIPDTTGLRKDNTILNAQPLFANINPQD